MTMRRLGRPLGIVLFFWIDFDSVEAGMDSVGVEEDYDERL